ncbi:response regulator [Nocardioides sp. YIM 152315]|uniref:response regulator n=1 Tax=Nocardioides sp. YIM 152315 TaxID=3031760 RepID=UPI0023DC26D6|nr:response regulator [Nocardioides sp. YIM 152315]MDF1602814.1 response regulator [Nocardioides sp. YIM 152315]
MSDGSGNARPVALIIEDDQDTVDLLEVVLTQAGFAVLSADNAADGIALAQEHRPVLATIDVTMPGMDGLEATRRIRDFSATYIVIISSRSQETDILAGFDAGADDYVPKPIRPVELRARLAAVARRPAVEGADGAQQQPPAAWAPAAEDTARSEFLRQVAAGAPVTADVADEEDAETGKDGREGMLEVGMRFVGGWVEFRGLRINPARGIVVVDDRLVDLPQDQVDLLEVLMYVGSRTLSARQLALRVRGETEETSTTPHRQDERWIAWLMDGLRAGIKDDGPRPRWFQVLPRDKYRLVQPASDDAPAQDDAGGA